jgi:hypothetical protein
MFQKKILGVKNQRRKYIKRVLEIKHGEERGEIKRGIMSKWYDLITKTKEKEIVVSQWKE